jgi:glucose 1-dehydrogenase
MLAGKTVVVTGANSGIGEAVAKAAGAQGANVVVDYVSRPEAAENVVSEIERSGGEAIDVRADVSATTQLRALLGETLESYGRLDVWINNAGIEQASSILEVTEDDFDRVIGVNLKSAVFGTQIAAEQFIRQGSGGVIVNVSSVHEDWPMPGNLAYCVSKGGMRMLARTAGVELAGHNIRVINACPGAVATPINEDTMRDPAKLRRLRDAIPLGRLAEPEEIANIVVFLASDQNSYMTATSVYTDGGIMQNSPGL